MPQLILIFQTTFYLDQIAERLTVQIMKVLQTVQLSKEQWYRKKIKRLRS